MDHENGGNIVTGMRHIVRLKEMLQKWQTATTGGAAPKEMSMNMNVTDNNLNMGISPAITKRLRSCCNVYVVDSDEESCHSPDPPRDVPKGFLAVYVGRELRRFIIPTAYLSDPLFKVLLEKVEEEFGFDHSGGLTIPCEIETFKYLLNCMENHQKKNGQDQNDADRMEEMTEMTYDSITV